MLKKVLIAAFLSWLALWTNPISAQENTTQPATVTVTDTVLRAKVPRIGFNICQNPADDKSTMLQNCLNSNPGLEDGVLYRRLFVASAGNATTFEEPFAGDQDYRRVVPENFWQDAEFRVLDGKAAGRKGRIASCAYNADKKKTVYTVAGDGPAFAAGDLIWISQPKGKGPLCITGWQPPPPANGVMPCADETDHAPFYGGKSCLRLTEKDMAKTWKNIQAWMGTFQRWGGGRRDRERNADRFIMEKAYRITLWAKGTPGAKLSVRFVASSEPGSPQPDDITLTANWRKYELVRRSDPMVNLVIVLTGGSEMSLDNFIISEDDGGEPLAILPRVSNALADLKPGTLRLLGGARGESLDNWRAHPLERLRTAFPPHDGPDQPNLPDSLNLCERVGASPWLVMGLAMNEDDWDNLLEYLAGPADSPYGAKRAQDGQPESWLKTFDAVYLELGDEAWNKSNSPWNIEDPVRYASLAQRVFSRVRQSKYYSPKIRLVANGCAGDPAWNAAVWKNCKSLDVLNCPAAIGGRESIAANVEKLLAWPVTQDMPQFTAALQSAKTANKAWALGGCETVSAEPGFLGPERSLFRSQAGAVAMLDELMLALATGSENAIFSRFAQGSDNATHVDAHELALHPAAQAIRLFNTHAGGMDLVASTLSPATATTALAAYAFKGPGGYRVLLLNRSLKTSYRTTLSLPKAAAKVKCYRIAGEDPLANNLEKIQVTTEEFDGNPAAGILVPAHGIVLIQTSEVEQ